MRLELADTLWAKIACQSCNSILRSRMDQPFQNKSCLANNRTVVAMIANG